MIRSPSADISYVNCDVNFITYEIYYCSLNLFLIKTAPSQMTNSAVNLQLVLKKMSLVEFLRQATIVNNNTQQEPKTQRLDRNDLAKTILFYERQTMQAQQKPATKWEITKKANPYLAVKIKSYNNHLRESRALLTWPSAQYHVSEVISEWLEQHSSWMFYALICKEKFFTNFYLLPQINK